MKTGRNVLTTLGIGNDRELLPLLIVIASKRTMGQRGLDRLFNIEHLTISSRGVVGVGRLRGCLPGYKISAGWLFVMNGTRRTSLECEKARTFNHRRHGRSGWTIANHALFRAAAAHFSFLKATRT